MNGRWNSAHLLHRNTGVEVNGIGLGAGITMSVNTTQNVSTTNTQTAIQNGGFLFG
jgi:hypothetical protein